MTHTTIFALMLAVAGTSQLVAAPATDEGDMFRDSLLHDVVVTGTRAATSEADIISTVTTVPRSQLTALERVSMLPTLSELVPGLYVTSRGVMGYGVSTGAAGSITLRGLSAGSGQAVVLIDGQPQYQGIFGHSIADAYQTLLAERVEVVRGPASLLYGSNGMGGVVNIITRQQHDNGVRTDFTLAGGSYNSVSSEAHNSVRAGRFFSDVAASYQSSDNHRPDMGFYQYGGYAKLGYDLSAHWRATAQADFTHFAASNPGPESAPLVDARQWINRGVAQVRVENSYDRTAGSLSVYHNFGRHKINDGHTADALPRDYLFRSRDALTGVSVSQGVSLIPGNWITVGADYQRIHGECWNSKLLTHEHWARPMEQNMHYPLDRTLTELAAYADLRQDITSWLTIEAGLRYDHHSEAGTELVPQGGIVVRPVADGQLKLTAGKGFRAPTLREMYLYGIANPDLEPERLWNYEVAWKHHPADGSLSYGINVFYLRADNLIATTMVPALGRAANYNTGRREHYGMELEASYAINAHWRTNANASYLHMDTPLLAAPELKAYAGAAYRLRALEVNAGVQYVAGLCTDVATGHEENVVLVNGAVAYRVVPQVKVWVRGENLLARKYEINAGYPMPRATLMAGIHTTF